MLPDSPPSPERRLGVSGEGGEYDAVVTIEAPDDETYATFVLNIAAQGNIRTTTLKAFSEEESFRILGNLS